MDKSGGISRPPSRVSDAGSTTGMPFTPQARADWTADYCSLAVQNDDDPNSQHFPIMMDPSGQETGVTDAQGTKFRQVEDHTYHNEDWSLVPHQAQEIFPNPTPQSRRRQPGAPAFVKPSPQGSYLPALLTILQAIPFAREALLARDFLLDDYGHGSDWWKGRPIPTSSQLLLDVEESEHMLDSSLIHECQRLMAFLELTERAYGNAEVLGDAIAAGTPERQPHQFLDDWRQTIRLLQPENPHADMFLTRYSCIDPAAPSHREDQLMSVVDLTVAEPGSDVYRAMDKALWGSLNVGDPCEASLEFGDILILRVERDRRMTGPVGSGVNVNVPEYFYVDRYLKENAGTLRDMRVDVTLVEEEKKRLTDRQAKLRRVENPAAGAGTLDASQLHEVLKPYLTQADVDYLANTASTEGYASTANGVTPEQAELFDIAKELQVVADRVTAKYRALEAAKEDAEDQLRQAGAYLTDPFNSPANAQPQHRFTLRGVAADPAITFVYHNAHAPDDLMGADEDDWGWWRCAYTPAEPTPVRCMEVTDEYVLHAARNDYPSVFLVYARDAVATDHTEPLPDPLKRFVEADNRAFADELAGHSSPPSTKRKADDDVGVGAAVEEPNWGGYRDDDLLREDPHPAAPSPAAAAAAATGELINVDPAPPPATTPPMPSAPPPTAPPPYYHRKPVPPAPPPRKAAQRQQQAQAAATQEQEPREGSATPTAAGTPAAAREEPDGGSRDADLLGEDDVPATSEMRERTGRGGELLGGAGAGLVGGVTGQYAPEIRMPDLEEEKADAKGASSG